MNKERLKRPARLQDVAKLAGVSTGTVSNALNRPHKVTPQTLAKVQESIEALGFVRDSNASSLAAGGSQHVGLVVIHLGNSIFVDAARGAQSAARAAGLNLLIADSDDDYELQSRNVDSFNEARAAGLLLAPMEDSSEQIARFTRRNRPLVMMNYDPGDLSVCCAVIDNEQGGYIAAQHLLEQGRKRIAFIYSRDDMQPVALRRQGVRRAMSEAGEGVIYEEIVAGGLDEIDGQNVGAMLGSRGPTTIPDGIVAVTDVLAVSIVNELLSRKIRIPEDVAVIGCDHNRSAPESQITVSTVKMRGLDMGIAAMRLLIDELEQDPQEHVHQRVVLEPSVLQRMSTMTSSS